MLLVLIPSSHADIAVASLAFEILRTVGHENIKTPKWTIFDQPVETCRLCNRLITSVLQEHPRMSWADVTHLAIWAAAYAEFGLAQEGREAGLGGRGGGGLFFKPL